MQPEARRAAERAARHSYGRLVAYLSARSRDLAAAEDALAEAFRAALETWPERGIPDRPEAWLLTVARRSLIRTGVRAARHAAAVTEIGHLAEAEAPDAEPAPVPNSRLELMFVCAHPAIDPAIRTALMLQAVLGLDAARIAAAFLVSPTAMGQRLVRAKAKIRDAGIGFTIPGREELPERLEAVLDAIYAAYGRGWDEHPGSDDSGSGLAGEAVDLARVLVQLLPDEPEPAGLLALLLHCEARRAARRDRDGRYVPLSEQDVALWSASLMAEAERQLERAASHGRPGRFQTEAAIQSVHAARAATGEVNWAALAFLYDVLVEGHPTAGAIVGRAAALGEHLGPEAGLAALDAVPADIAAGYQPWWAVRAHLLSRLGRADAEEAFSRAIALSEDPAIQAFLLGRMGASPVPAPP